MRSACILLLFLATIVISASDQRYPYSKHCPFNTTNTASDNAITCHITTVPASEQCGFAKSACCGYTQDQYGWIDFVTAEFCSTVPSVIYFILYIVFVVYAFVVTAHVANAFFAPTMAHISQAWNLSDNVAGVTFMAFGNGGSDLFSAFAALRYNSSRSLGMTGLLGTGLIIPVVVFSVIGFGPGEVKVSNPRAFFRDTLFLIISALAVLLIAADRKINLWEMITLLLLYIVYVGSAIAEDFYVRSQLKGRRSYRGVTPAGKEEKFLVPSLQPSLNKQKDELNQQISLDRQSLEHQGIYAANDQSLSHSMDTPSELAKQNSCGAFLKLLLRFPIVVVDNLCWVTIPVITSKRWSDQLAILHCFSAPLLVLYDFRLLFKNIYFGTSKVPVLAIVGPLLLIFSLVVSVRIEIKKRDAVIWNDGVDVRSIRDDDDVEHEPVFPVVFLILGFLSSMAWVHMLSIEIINALMALGVSADIQTDFLGAIFMALGNSVQDIAADVAMINRGFSRMSVAAALGGPNFNIMVGVGVGMLVVLSQNGGTSVVVPFTDHTLLCCIFIITMNVFNIIYLKLSNWRLNRSFAYYLIAFYSLFVIVAIIFMFVHVPGTVPQ